MIQLRARVSCLATQEQTRCELISLSAACVSGVVPAQVAPRHQRNRDSQRRSMEQAASTDKSAGSGGKTLGNEVYDLMV